jgi:hypothetical protein
VGRGRVNQIEEGEAIYLMGFIYIYKIDQWNLLQSL